MFLYEGKQKQKTLVVLYNYKFPRTQYFNYIMIDTLIKAGNKYN